MPDALVIVGLVVGLIVLPPLSRWVERAVERGAERRTAVLPPSKHAIWVNLRTGKFESRATSEGKTDG